MATTGDIQTPINLVIEQTIRLPLPLAAIILTLGQHEFAHPLGHQTALLKLQGAGIPVELLSSYLFTRLSDQLILGIQCHTKTTAGHQG